MQTGLWQLGLFLLPNEIKLFKKEDISPMWGIGKSKPTVIRVAQLNTQDCPHIRKDDLCAIYEKRPVICRAHPLTIEVDPQTSIPVAASVDSRCNGAKGIPVGQVKLSEYFSDAILHANAELTGYLAEMFRRARGKAVWLFDLKTEKWIEVTVSTVQSMSCCSKAFNASNPKLF